MLGVCRGFGSTSRYALTLTLPRGREAPRGPRSEREGVDRVIARGSGSGGSRRTTHCGSAHRVAVGVRCLLNIQPAADARILATAATPDARCHNARWILPRPGARCVRSVLPDVQPPLPHVITRPEARCFGVQQPVSRAG
jgi:hypothetical protein